ncbi:MAG: chloride channel protein [Elusimicrobia bacterium]|nr:chloride channel protein [Elusimicrobiota bacterium]MDE2510977.1 chloride channel protein [Elusimicrobiota bacterium]
MSADGRPAGAREALRSALKRLAREQPFDRRLLLAGVAVGVATGLAAYGFHVLLDMFGDLRDSLGQAGPILGPAAVVLLPALGGLASGWLTRRRYPEASGHGVAEVARAINEKDGQISAHVAWVKSLASAATIGLGGSAGLEGPVVQIGSSVGSALGRLFGSSPRDLRTFVAAGAVGGLSAAFGIPLAGVFFTMEVILKDFANEAFPAVVVSSVTGAVVSRALLHGTVMAPMLGYEWVYSRNLFFYAGLGLVCALLGRAYTAAIHAVEGEFGRWSRVPDWTRPAFGGFLVGALTLAAPRVAGTGRDAIASMLKGEPLGWNAPLLALAKLAATALTLGSGGSGGALMPTLFIGAAAGSGWGQALSVLGQTIPAAGAFALAGLCGVFTAAFYAPITGMMIGVEMTRDYGLVVPIMVCCAVSYVSSRRPRA